MDLSETFIFSFEFRLFFNQFTMKQFNIQEYEHWELAFQ